MLTLAGLESRAAPYLAGTSAALLNPREIVNSAGRYLAHMHPWKWRERPPTTLNFTSGVEYVAMPTGATEITEARSASLNREFHLTTPGHILELRQSSLAMDWAYYGALVQPDQASATAQMGVPRIELWPTPSSSVTGAVRVSYRVGWIDLTAPNAVPDIPPFLEPLLVELVRAYAAGEARGDLLDRLDRVTASAMTQNFKDQDGRTQEAFGRLRNGIVQMQTEGDRWWDSTVASP